MKYYRLLSMVPALPQGPDAPPIPLDTLVELFMDDLSERDRELALVLLGYLDCRNVEALLQGYDAFDERAPLSREQLIEREDLPEYLSEFLEAHDAGSITDEYPFDALWRAWFENLVESAELSGSVFLREWAIFEINLREALVRTRAEALGEKAEMRSLGVAVGEGESHVALLSTLNEANNPMERERLLDAARLDKLESISGSDPFSTDAALSTLAALLILDRWDVGKTADVSKMLEVFA
jgi:hypothetical protein